MDTSADRFYAHVVFGPVGDSRPLLARIALHLSEARGDHPMQLGEILALRERRRDLHMHGFDELVLADFLRERVLCGPADWSDEQLTRLGSIATSQGAPFRLALVKS